MMKPTILSAVVLTAMLAAAPILAAIPYGNGLSFEVLRDDSSIGHHRVDFERKGDELHVKVDIDLAVKLAFVTVFRYTHQNHEIWKDGRLVSIETETNDNGDEYSLTGRASDQGFVVEGHAGKKTLPADIIPTSYWHPDTVEQTQLLDTQKGRLMEVKIAREGSDALQVGGRGVEAERYRVSGDLRMRLWYTPERRWAKIAFEARGAEVVYDLEDDLMREASLEGLQDGQATTVID